MEHWEKRGIHVGVYLSFGQIQPGVAALAGTLHQTPAAPVPPARHTHTVHTQVFEHTYNTNFTTHTHIHTYLSILAISRCVCLSLPTVLGPPRAGISLSFPQTHTHVHTHIHTLLLKRGAVCEPTVWSTCIDNLQLRVTRSHFVAVPLARNSLCPALSPFWLLTLGLSADTLRPPRLLITPLSPSPCCLPRRCSYCCSAS